MLSLHTCCAGLHRAAGRSTDPVTSLEMAEGKIRAASGAVSRSYRLYGEPEKPGLDGETLTVLI